jgi:hypothetical protein
MKIKILICIFFLISAIGASILVYGKPGAENKPLRIILIRHGEKPDDGDNLSCAGLNRSLKLPAVLKSKFGIPDNIYVPSPGTGKQTKNCRMLQTITPFAVKYNLPINTNYSIDEASELAKKIKNSTGTVLVVWEHNDLVTIAQALGVKRYFLTWRSDDYDSIWIITFNNGVPVLTKDKEEIKPAETCPF